jgi:diguanylate cyclase (GGDEF)-like protein
MVATDSNTDAVVTPPEDAPADAVAEQPAEAVPAGPRVKPVAKSAGGGATKGGKADASRKKKKWQQRLQRALNGKAGRRLAIILFSSMMAVQLLIIIMGAGLSLSSQKAAARNNIIEDVKAIISVAASNQLDPRMPISISTQQTLLSKTPVTGFSVYNAALQPVQVGGEPIVTKLTPETDREAILSTNGRHFEVVIDQNDIGGNYIYIARVLNNAKTALNWGFLAFTILLSVIISAGVTVFIMVGQHITFIEPFLFVRRGLVKAARQPEQPVIDRSPYGANNEIGETILLVQDLIRTNAKNLTQMKNAAQTQIHKLAYFDTLTSLPNRTLFIRELDRLTRLAEEKTGKRERYAVVTADLDHFKDFNDSMGHAVGDAILKAVGKRLRAALPHSAVVARCGEDEFAIAMPLTGPVNSASTLGDWVLRIIKSSPYEIFNETFQVRASAGAATFPDNSPEPEQALRNADIALNRAKEEGRDCLREYLPDFDAAVQARFQMLRDLRVALEKQELALHYQPQLDLQSGRIIGTEALIRWFQPDPSAPNGTRFISPAQFIPVAEQSGLIVPIGEWVMRKAVETMRNWHSQGLKLRMAVNVSGQQFYKSDLVAVTKSIINEAGIEPQWLELEITESVFMDDMQLAIDTLKRLHDLGVEIAIDDFGTGYSSLSYLRQLPIDRIKIDQSFVRNSLTNDADAAVTRAIIRMCHSLKLKTIAEGVETREHEYFLRAENCDEVQGWRYSKALPENDLREFAKRYPGDLSHFDLNPGHNPA